MKKYLTKLALTVIVFINVLSAFQAWNFIHYTEQKNALPKLGKMSVTEKIKALFTGAQLPKISFDENVYPQYQKIKLGKDSSIAAWLQMHINSKGIIIVAHGRHGGNKAMMHARAQELHQLGFSTLLLDFKGHGNSAGNTTSFGFYEANDIKTAYDYCKQNFPNQNIFALGTSMGAVAIARAQHDLGVDFKKVILECPYASLKIAVHNRFKILKCPSMGLENMLLIYGSIFQKFNAFALAPQVYAKGNNTPVLIFRGALDTRVEASEVKSIFNNWICTNKKLVTLKNSDHANFLDADYYVWKNEIALFLNN